MAEKSHHDELTDKVSILCETLSNFESDCFGETGGTRNAVILPAEVFEENDWIEEYGYARAVVGENAASPEIGHVVQVAKFSSYHDAEEYSSNGIPEACVRSTLQDRIGVNFPEGLGVVSLYPCESESVTGLKVERVTNVEQQQSDTDTLGAVCYIHETTRRKLGIREGDPVEVVNSASGARIRLPTKTGGDLRYNEDWVRLDRNSRTHIAVEPYQAATDSASTVAIRVPPSTAEQRLPMRIYDRLAHHLGRIFVDYSKVRLQIIQGRDRDEDRNMVRLDESTMKSLGIKEHDKVILEWQDRTQSVRCLKDITDDGTGPLKIRVPSTERDKLEVSVGDCVDVRRDMKYSAGKEAALSVLGFLAVLVNMDVILRYISLEYAIGLLGGLLLLTFYLVLLPTRQQCR